MAEYERRREENIKRNAEKLAALNIHSKLSELSTVAASKFPMAGSKSSKGGPVKKPSTEPVVLRQSLRSRKLPPDDVEPVQRKPPTVGMGPLEMRDAYVSDNGSDEKFRQTILQCCKEFLSGETDRAPCASGSVDAGKLELKSKNIARLGKFKITSMVFFPTADMQMVVAGNKSGEVCFWKFNGDEEEGGEFYMYQPHLMQIRAIAIAPFSISQMYSCDEGYIRLMDVEKEVFDMVYSSDFDIHSMSLSPHGIKSLYFSEGFGPVGGVKMWDVRTRRSILSWELHVDKVNTIDFNSEDENIMATSSSDGTACIWDLRHMTGGKPTPPLKTVRHIGSVESAYFSPTGKLLATTSLDNNIGLLSGANYENASMVNHYNPTNRMNCTFRGIWGWDDSSIYIGNAKKGIDIISVAKEKTVAHLTSWDLSGVLTRLDVHPYNVGTIAGCTSGGRVYIWTPS
ncbi:hypothetical protein ABFS82_07G006000 [Erythranthe guttata]|uniref:Uncharacterized protein n=1 Tax=Erythranthe guttata TaxID=4155 RepID=A0A022QPZ7_ERYGU|nr:PREDICTED: DNA damage-binding protein CMR1-like [Erythranthe guttata]EYU29659.1 hypothetical protein MIMGU_mgv1a006151mg [Erythranthe guttata]|eukprot:XP_012846642.1 PREDICTED: DNA damage-binding protein CMR1-like [Erythranthe guttata]